MPSTNDQILELVALAQTTLHDIRLLADLLDRTLTTLSPAAATFPAEWKILADIPAGPNSVYQFLVDEQVHKMVIVRQPSTASELAFSDLHGDLGVLFSLLPQILTNLKKGGVVIANGDIFAPIRGEKTCQLTSLLVIFALINCYPQQFFYVRGNHEEDGITEELILGNIERELGKGVLPENKQIIAAKILNIFTQLPRVVISKQQQAIYVHAGLPTLPPSPTIADILANPVDGDSGAIIPTSHISLIPNRCSRCFTHKEPGQELVLDQAMLSTLALPFAYIFTSSNELFYYNNSQLEQLNLPADKVVELAKQIGITDSNKTRIIQLGTGQFKIISQACYAQGIEHDHINVTTQRQLELYGSLGITAINHGHDHLHGHIFKTSAYTIGRDDRVFATFTSSYTHSRSLMLCSSPEERDSAISMLPRHMQIVMCSEQRDSNFAISIEPTFTCYCVHGQAVRGIQPLDVVITSEQIDRLLQATAIPVEKWPELLHNAIKRNAPHFGFFAGKSLLSSQLKKFLEKKIHQIFEQKISLYSKIIQLESFLCQLIANASLTKQDKKAIFTIIQEYSNKKWRDSYTRDAYRLLIPDLSLLYSKMVINIIIEELADQQFATDLSQKQIFWQNMGLSPWQQQYKLLLCLINKISRLPQEDPSYQYLAVINEEIPVIIRHLAQTREMTNLFQHTEQFNYPAVLDLLDIAMRQEGLEDVVINMLEQDLEHNIYDQYCLPLCYNLLICAANYRGYSDKAELYTAKLLALPQPTPEDGRTYALYAHAIGLYFRYTVGDNPQAEIYFNNASLPTPFPPSQYQLLSSILKQYVLLSPPQLICLENILKESKIQTQQQIAIMRRIIGEQKTAKFACLSQKQIACLEALADRASSSLQPLELQGDETAIIKSITTSTEVNPQFQADLDKLEQLAKSIYLPAIQELLDLTKDEDFKRLYIRTIFPFCESKNRFTAEAQRLFARDLEQHSEEAAAAPSPSTRIPHP